MHFFGFKSNNALANSAILENCIIIIISWSCLFLRLLMCFICSAASELCANISCITCVKVRVCKRTQCVCKRVCGFRCVTGAEFGSWLCAITGSVSVQCTWMRTLLLDPGERKCSLSKLACIYMFGLSWFNTVISWKKSTLLPSRVLATEPTLTQRRLSDVFMPTSAEKPGEV